MKRTFRAWFWIKAGVAAVSGILAVVTLFWQDWIEALTGFDPDSHDGSVEWAIVFGLAVICAVMSVAARSEWRRSTSSAAIV